MPRTFEIELPEAFQDLFRPCRHKIYFGGRGGGKSWALARALILKAITGKHRILCAREYQTSIADSVHHLLETQIDELGYNAYFTIGKAVISSVYGSEFIFKGLHHKPHEIKSIENIDYCWVEEAQSVSEESWRILTPTIRKEGSEIWVSFNPMEEDAPTYQRWVANPPPNTIVRKVNWDDNPYFPSVLDAERRHMMETDPEAYAWIWGGDTRKISNAVIFKGKYVVKSFETPDNVRFYHGLDFGFSTTPLAFIRCFINDGCLFIDHEGYGLNIENDDIPALLDLCPTARAWPIKGDASRPETISYLRNRGFRISAAKKWPGSIEDGIEHLRGNYRQIVIHERCRHMADEARLYSYKVDRQTGDILPLIVDKNNDCWDALRYALDGVIVSSQRHETHVGSFRRGVV